jgi:predicted nucleotidyltransferase
MENTTFLSARVPLETKRRLKEIAARKGVTLQDLVARMAEELIERESREAPVLAEVILRLREAKPALTKGGVSHLYVFGSVARGEAREGSDIDLAAEFRHGTPLSLTRLAAIRADLESLLGFKVDLSQRKAVKPPARADMERDAVKVF